MGRAWLVNISVEGQAKMLILQRGKVLRVILALLGEDNSEQFSSELWDWWNMVSLSRLSDLSMAHQTVFSRTIPADHTGGHRYSPVVAVNTSRADAAMNSYMMHVMHLTHSME